MTHDISTPESDKQEISIDFKSVLIIVLLLIYIFFIAFATKDKEDEEKRLVNRYNKLIRQKELIILLKLNLDSIFKKAYNLIKLTIVVLICSALTLTCLYTKVGADDSLLFTMMNNCLTLIASFSFTVLLFCFLFEQNPINIFNLRAILFSMTQNLVYRKYTRHLEKIPEIEKEIEAVKLRVNVEDVNV